MKRLLICLAGCMLVCTTTASYAMNKEDATAIIVRAEKMLEQIDSNRVLGTYIPFDIYGEALINIIFSRNLLEEEKYVESYFYGAASIIRLETAEIIAKTRKARYEQLLIERDAASTIKKEEGLPEGMKVILEANLTKKGPALVTTIYDERLFTPSNRRLTMTISSEGRERLDRIIRVLKQFPACTVTIAGHTEENDGTDLSQRKARRTAEYLIQRGILPGRISITGIGNHEVMATHRGYERVNRVEIIITGIR